MHQYILETANCQILIKIPLRASIAADTCRHCRASYRDLLGTAESIIDMDGKMRRVETLMGDIGTKCNTRLIDRKNANLHAWDKHVSANGRIQGPLCMECD